MPPIRIALALSLLAQGAAAPPPATAEDLAPVVKSARTAVESFFGKPFAEPFAIDVFPHRKELDAALAKAFGMESTQCWMVAAGVADHLYLLAPAVWNEEACEHDGADPTHVAEIVTHELVHVFHGQNNPTRDFTGLDDIGWFCEGLATFASGQLARGHKNAAKDALAAGKGPVDLETAWSGRWRYGVCGSLVAFYDHKVGRAKLIEMLGAKTEAELLAPLELTEAEFLAAWREWLAKDQH